MSRRIRAAFEALVRLMLVLGLAFSPLAQPMALAALATVPQESMAGCPHHAKSAQLHASPEQPRPGDCCYKKGSPCHCAMTVALPATITLTIEAAASEHPVSAPRLAASLLPTPEPPPPRT